MNELTQTLVILSQAAEMAQQKGAFALQDAAIIAQAVKFANEYVEKEKTNAQEVAEAPTTEKKPLKKVK